MTHPNTHIGPVVSHAQYCELEDRCEELKARAEKAEAELAKVKARTTPDVAELIAKLNRRGSPHSIGGASLFNSNGPEAASALESLSAELAKVRAERDEALDRECSAIVGEIDATNRAAVAVIRAESAEQRLAQCEAALRKAADDLDEACEEVAVWGAYASEYFQDKHDLEGGLDHIAFRAKAARAYFANKEKDDE